MLPDPAASDSLRRRAVSLFAAGGNAPRLAMRGTSMLPLLAEPMVLQLGRFEGRPKLGDVLVFQDGDRFVAHRYLATGADGRFVLAGDAAHDAYDVIAAEGIVGRVAAVWSGAGDDAHRIDTRFFHLRGFALAARRALRLRVRRWRARTTFVLRRANPRTRPRAYVALFRAMAAILQNDAQALRASVSSVDPELLRAQAVRHRCAPLLVDGLERYGATDSLPPPIVTALRRERWAAATRVRGLRLQLADVLRLAAAANVAPVLLKGAARAFRAERDGDRHSSDDIDVLLPRDHIDAMTGALRTAGYYDDPQKAAYYESKHHTPPLFPPGNGLAVELHHALAPPNDVRARTDAEALAARIRFVDVPDGRVGLLDDFASALHSAVHAREPTQLRNLVILALQLRELSFAERAELARVADREGAERTRIHAALHAGSRLAGVPSFAPFAARRLFAWRLRRFDLPYELSIRTTAIEWFVASSGREVGAIVRAFVPWENDRERAVPVLRRALAYAVKLALKPAIFLIAAAYAALMPATAEETSLVRDGEQPAAGKIV